VELRKPAERYYGHWSDAGWSWALGVNLRREPDGTQAKDNRANRPEQSGGFQ
jgi:hypothetical protein